MVNQQGHSSPSGIYSPWYTELFMSRVPLMRPEEWAFFIPLWSCYLGGSFIIIYNGILHITGEVQPPQIFGAQGCV